MGKIAAVCVFKVCFLLLSLQVAVAEKQVGCRTGWLTYEKICFLIRGGHDGFATAKDRCESLGAQLAVLDSASKRDFIFSQLHMKCVDNVAHCHQLANEGYCVKYHKWMRENCPFSCGLCSTLCENDPDKNGKCAYWASQNLCFSDPTFMTKHCHKSCGCGGFSDNYWVARYFESYWFLMVVKENLKTNKCVQVITQSGTWEKSWCDFPGGAGYICEMKQELQDLPAGDPLRKGCPLHGFGHGAKCYILNLASHSWKNAAENCKKKDGVLASIPNKEVLEFVTSELLTNENSTWVGLRRNSANEYTWLGGNKVTYLPWKASFTGNNQAGDCVQLTSTAEMTFLEPAKCSAKQTSVCEIPRAGVPEETEPEMVVLSKCPQHWAEHDEFCYRLFKGHLTWQGAQSECRKHNGDLMSVHTRDAQQFLVQTIYNSSTELNVWIGLIKKNKTKGYEWSDESPFDFSKLNYASGVSLDTHCVQAGLRSSSWSGVPCNSKRSYICQQYRGHPPPETKEKTTTPPQRSTTKPSPPSKTTPPQQKTTKPPPPPKTTPPQRKTTKPPPPPKTTPPQRKTTKPPPPPKTTPPQRKTTKPPPPPPKTTPPQRKTTKPPPPTTKTTPPQRKTTKRPPPPKTTPPQLPTTKRPPPPKTTRPQLPTTKRPPPPPKTTPPQRKTTKPPPTTAKTTPPQRKTTKRPPPPKTTPPPLPTTADRSIVTVIPPDVGYSTSKRLVTTNSLFVHFTTKGSTTPALPGDIPHRVNTKQAASKKLQDDEHAPSRQLLSLGQIVGIVCACTAGVFLLSIGLACFARHRKRFGSESGFPSANAGFSHQGLQYEYATAGELEVNLDTIHLTPGDRNRSTNTVREQRIRDSKKKKVAPSEHDLGSGAALSFENVLYTCGENELDSPMSPNDNESHA